MAKIDITKLEGYREDMTAEDKLKLFESYEIPEPDYSGYVKKDVFDRAASEAADWKKKYNAKLTDEEKYQNEQKEKEARLAELEKKVAIDDLIKKYLTKGYDEKMAQESAEAQFGGNVDKVLEIQDKFLEVKKQELEKKLLNQTPPPPAGTDKNSGKGKVDFAKMSLMEIQKYYEEHPDEKPG